MPLCVLPSACIGHQALYECLGLLSSAHLPLLTGIWDESLLNNREERLHFHNSASLTPAEMKNLFVHRKKEECSYFWNDSISVFSHFVEVLNCIPSPLICHITKPSSRSCCTFCVFLVFTSPPSPILRCLWENDRDGDPGEPSFPADLRRGQAARLHSRHRSRLLDHPHGLQHLVVQTPKEEEWPLQQLCRHTQRSVH